MKDCAVCGGKPFIILVISHTRPLLATGYQVICLGDDCTNSSGEFRYESEAIEAWDSQSDTEVNLA